MSYRKLNAIADIDVRIVSMLEDDGYEVPSGDVDDVVKDIRDRILEMATEDQIREAIKSKASSYR